MIDSEIDHLAATVDVWWALAEPPLTKLLG